MRQKINPLDYSIEIQKKDSLVIILKTKRLIIRSVLNTDENEFLKLLSDPSLMKRYSAGIPYTPEEIISRINLWTGRAKNFNPFNVYTILEKQTNSFIGFISISPHNPGETQTSYIIHQNFQGKGYGREAISAVAYVLVPKLMDCNYQVLHRKLKKMTATTRIDNNISIKMLEGANFKKEKQVIRDDHQIYSYGLFAKQARNENQRFFYKRQLQKYNECYEKFINTSVSVSAEEMAASDFGQSVSI